MEEKAIAPVPSEKAIPDYDKATEFVGALSSVIELQDDHIFQALDLLQTSSSGFDSDLLARIRDMLICLSSTNRRIKGYSGQKFASRAEQLDQQIRIIGDLVNKSARATQHVKAASQISTSMYKSANEFYGSLLITEENTTARTAMQLLFSGLAKRYGIDQPSLTTKRENYFKADIEHFRTLFKLFVKVNNIRIYLCYICVPCWSIMVVVTKKIGDKTERLIPNTNFPVLISVADIIDTNFQNVVTLKPRVRLDDLMFFLYKMKDSFKGLPIHDILSNPQNEQGLVYFPLPTMIAPKTAQKAVRGQELALPSPVQHACYSQRSKKSINDEKPAKFKPQYHWSYFLDSKSLKSTQFTDSWLSEAQNLMDSDNYKSSSVDILCRNQQIVPIVPVLPARLDIRSQSVKIEALKRFPDVLAKEIKEIDAGSAEKLLVVKNKCVYLIPFSAADTKVYALNVQDYKNFSKTVKTVWDSMKKKAGHLKAEKESQSLASEESGAEGNNLGLPDERDPEETNPHQESQPADKQPAPPKEQSDPLRKQQSSPTKDLLNDLGKRKVQEEDHSFDSSKVFVEDDCGTPALTSAMRDLTKARAERSRLRQLKKPSPHPMRKRSSGVI